MKDYEKHLSTINTYEMALLDKNVSHQATATYLEKLKVARNKFFYSLVDLAEKSKKYQKILLDESNQYSQFVSCMLQIAPTTTAFNSHLDKLLENYKNVQEFDEHRMLLSRLLSILSDTTAHIRRTNPNETEKTSKIYDAIKILIEKVQTPNVEQ